MVKRRTIFFLAVFLLIIPGLTFLSSQCQAATNLWKFPGVMFKSWDYSNVDFSKTCPSCGPIGGIFFVDWNRINPGNGSVDTGLIENFLNQAKQMQTAPFPDGRKIPKPVLVEISFFRGADGDLTPGWVYQSGASQQTVDCSGTIFKAPPYNNQTWKQAYFNLIKALGSRFNQPENFPSLAGFIFATGYDDEAYPVISTCRQGGAGYAQFLKELAQVVGSSFTRIPAYLQAGGEDYTPLITEQAAKYHLGAKANSLSPGGEHCCFSWNGSGDYRSILGNKSCATTSLAHSAVLVSNEQVSWAMEDARSWCYDCPWETYYQWLIPISLHADWIDWRDVQVFQKMTQAYPSFVNNFVPSYLGKTKANTPGVWIGFRDVHDPTIYSSGGRPKEIVCWTGSTGPACHSHKIGNLDYYLTRVGADDSKPIFRENFPAAAQSQPYGFGRSLENGKKISLKIEDGVWFKSGERNISLKVILLNSSSGSFEVELKKSDGSLYKETITKGSNLGQVDKFVEVTRNINQVKFDGSFENGADLVISAKDSALIIHLLEIKPGSGQNPTPTGGVATPTAPATLTVTPNPNNVRLNFSAGWNFLAWKNIWSANVSFNNLPADCLFSVFNNKNRFLSFYRNDSQEKFSPSGNYFIFCQSSTTWSF